MNIKFLKIALGLAFTAVAFNASAQKNYTQGTITYSLEAGGTQTDSKVYFTADSSASVTQYGPANIKLLTNNKATYMAVFVDVPVASIKKVAVFTPDEIDQAMAGVPKFTFTSGTETKQINGFNCKSVTAKDSKSGSSYIIWITTDIKAPSNIMSKSFEDAGGFPVQFTTTKQGQTVNITLKSITEDKAPAGTFGIPPGYDKISLDDLKAMSGGK
ncbi:MAG: hypothetical protein JWQ79_783 [Mucilaginibacter sp.]|nr:hypothetical protein [Mucilaginibacter sp.]